MSSKDGFVCYLSLGCLVFFFFCCILSLQPIRASIVKTHNASQIAMQELNQNQFHQFCLYGLIENNRWTDSVCPSSWREERKQTGGQEEKEQKETDSERERERETQRERQRERERRRERDAERETGGHVQFFHTGIYLNTTDSA